MSTQWKPHKAVEVQPSVTERPYPRRRKTITQLLGQIHSARQRSTFYAEQERQLMTELMERREEVVRKLSELETHSTSSTANANIRLFLNTYL